MSRVTVLMNKIVDLLDSVSGLYYAEDAFKEIYKLTEKR